MASDLSAGSSGLWVEAEDIFEWFSDRPSGYGRSLKSAKSTPDPYIGAKPPSWTEQSACLTNDGMRAHDRAFDAPGSQRAVEAAKAVCAECPVREMCLEDAMDREGGLRPSNRYGIFGGLTPKERFQVVDRNRVSRAYRLYQENLERWKQGARDKDAVKARNRQLQRMRRAKERRMEAKTA